MNPIDRNKIWKMVGILALITVVAGGLLRVSQHSSYTLEDYAVDNPSLAYQTAEPSPAGQWITALCRLKCWTTALPSILFW